MERIEVGGMIYEFEDGISLMAILDENADRVYEGAASEPPNVPLTMEELREMDGEAVWISFDENMWHVFIHHKTCDGIVTGENNFLWFESYGKTWLAYRHKPEEVQR